MDCALAQGHREARSMHLAGFTGRFWAPLWGWGHTKCSVRTANHPQQPAPEGDSGTSTDHIVFCAVGMGVLSTKTSVQCWLWFDYDLMAYDSLWLVDIPMLTALGLLDLWEYTRPCIYPPVWLLCLSPLTSGKQISSGWRLQKKKKTVFAAGTQRFKSVFCSVDPVMLTQKY